MAEEDTERLTRELYSELVCLPPVELKVAIAIRDKLIIAYEEIEDDRGFVEKFIDILGREIAQCQKEKAQLAEGKPS